MEDVGDFRFFRDAKYLSWRQTLWYNVVRAACAGTVLCIVMVLIDFETPDKALELWVMYPIVYLVGILPMGIVLNMLRSIPFVGLFTAIFTLFYITCGDPIVWMLSKIFPSIVPVDSPPFMSLNLIFWVLDESKM